MEVVIDALDFAQLRRLDSTEGVDQNADAPEETQKRERREKDYS